jgi:hypothetical protein
MIARIRMVAVLIGLACPLWILGAVIWGVLAGKQQIQTPMLAVWLFLGAALVRLLLWAYAKVASRA